MKVDKRLKSVAPLWSEEIKHAKEPQELYRSFIKNGREMDLNLTDRCIVGEVYGWNTYQCKRCSDLGFHIWSWVKNDKPYEYAYNKRNPPKSFHQAIKMFLNHWKQKHDHN